MELDRKLLALTPKNAAILGVSDDFYSIYRDIIDMFGKERSRLVEETGGRWSVDKLAYSNIKKNVRAALEPVLNKYSALFIESPRVVHATAIMVTNLYPLKPIINALPEKQFRYREYTFDEFLSDLEIEIVAALATRFENEKRKKPYDVRKEVNDRLCAAIEEADKRRSINCTVAETVFAQKLHVFGRLSLTNCFQNKHPLEARSLYSFSADGTRMIVLPVHYCPVCKRNMIGQITLSLFDSSYGRVLAFRRICPDTGYEYSELTSESDLHQLGYDVSKEVGLTEDERRKLLTTLITYNILPYSEICNTIEQDIMRHRSDPRFQDAVLKWKRDLRFVGDLIIEDHKE